MFSCTVHILTLMAMLWHSVGGCCLHHSHAHCKGHEEANSSDSQESPSVCHHHHDCGEHNHSFESPEVPDESQAPCNGDHECLEGNCVYNKTASPELVDQQISPFQFDVVITSVPVSNGPGLALTLDRAEFSYDAKSSICRCAQMQTWQL